MRYDESVPVMKVQLYRMSWAVRFPSHSCGADHICFFFWNEIILQNGLSWKNKYFIASRNCWTRVGERQEIQRKFSFRQSDYICRYVEKSDENIQDVGGVAYWQTWLGRQSRNWGGNSPMKCVINLCTTTRNENIVRSALKMLLCVLYGSRNKPWLFWNTSLT